MADRQRKTRPPAVMAFVIFLIAGPRMLIPGGLLGRLRYGRMMGSIGAEP